MSTEANDFLRRVSIITDRLPIRIDASKQPDRLKKIKAEASLKKFLF